MKGSFAIIVDEKSRKKICSLILKENKKVLEIDGATYELEDTNVTALTEFKKQLVDSAIKVLEI